MTTLPASIEAYLLEAGFSATEVLVLKRLLEGDAMTLRELAAKTGKSTGVLDQATKKLSDKNILIKESVNGTPKYTLSSLDSINQWMEKDMNEKKAVLHRKKKDFDAFLATVEHEKDRPEMQYFEGLDGLQKAFTKLLEKESREWLHFVPALMREEDDPLCEFRVNLFRERRRNKIFMRSIGQDVPLGRRYQSRDVFEYRNSRLVPVDQFPVTFEEFIVGDTVACFDIPNQKASFINYPAMADSQKHMFEMLWCQAECSDDDVCEAEAESHPPQEPDLETKVFSGLREFFMSRGSLLVFAAFGLLSAAMTWGMYVNNQSLNFQRMQDKVVAIARTAALDIDINDLNQLKNESDYKKPVWGKVVNQLVGVKTTNSDILYVYIIRKSEKNSDQIEFVADAASIDPYANFDTDTSNDVDANEDGKIDPNGSDYLQWPGQEYPDPPEAAFNSFKGVSVSDFYEDQWGKVVSGYAPIMDSLGNTNAVLAVDIKAVKLNELTLQTFSPIYCFIGLFIIFVFIRLAAFHNALLRGVLYLLKSRRVLISLAVSAFIALLITLGMYRYTLNLMKQEIGNRLVSIVSTAAPDIDYRDLLQIRTEQDMYKPEYQKLFNKLNEIRGNNTNILYLYIMRPTEDPEIYEFVADADSNYFLPEDPNDPDAIEVLPPGTSYEINQLADDDERQILLKEAITDSIFVTDRWGTYLSASAPIFNENEEGVAILGVDMDVSDVYMQLNSRFKPYIWFLTIFGLLLVLRIFSIKRIVI